MVENKTGFEKIKQIDFSKYAPLLALVILILVSAFASEHFLKFRNITNILRQVSYTGTIALGMTFVIVAAGIDLSVGSMVAFVGVLAIYLMNYLGGGAMAVFVAVLCALVVGSLCGVFNGLIVTKGKITSFIATLATMSIFRSLTLYISEAGEVISNNDLYPAIGGGYFLKIPYPVIIFLGLAVFFSFPFEQHRLWQACLRRRGQSAGGGLFRHQGKVGHIYDFCHHRFYRWCNCYIAVFPAQFGESRRRGYFL